MFFAYFFFLRYLVFDFVLLQNYMPPLVLSDQPICVNHVFLQNQPLSFSSWLISIFFLRLSNKIAFNFFITYNIIVCFHSLKFIIFLIPWGNLVNELLPINTMHDCCHIHPKLYLTNPKDNHFQP